MKQTVLFFVFAFAAAPLTLIAQSSVSTPAFVSAESSSNGSGAGITRSSVNNPVVPAGPFSRVAFGGGVSPLGIQMQLATNLNSHLNLRSTGNFFNYSTNFTTNGINATAKLNMASAGASVDVYPFHAGFRISPGLLFYNQNQLTAAAVVAGGTSFTLNSQTFYSANANSATGATPVNGNGVLGLNARKPAFTITTGWGNMIPNKGGHWSFPFEIGAAFIGAPTVNLALNGWACYDQAQTQCTNIASTTNPIAIQVQSDLTTQVAKWTTDLNPLRTYPIVSGGIAYSFRIRNGRQ